MAKFFNNTAITYKYPKFKIYPKFHIYLKFQIYPKFKIYPSLKQIWSNGFYYNTVLVHNMYGIIALMCTGNA